MFQSLAAVGNSTSPNQSLDLAADTLMAALVVVVLLAGLLLIIKLALIWLMYDAAKAADPDKMTMKPGLVWLLLIPFFNFYWNFTAFPAVSESLSATARGKGKDVGDAGRSFGMAACYLALISLIFWVIAEFSHSFVTGGLRTLALLAMYVVFIIYVVKVRKAKSVINS